MNIISNISSPSFYIDMGKKAKAKSIYLISTGKDAVRQSLLPLAQEGYASNNRLLKKISHKVIILLCSTQNRSEAGAQTHTELIQLPRNLIKNRVFTEKQVERCLNRYPMYPSSKMDKEKLIKCFVEYITTGGSTSKGTGEIKPKNLDLKGIKFSALPKEIIKELCHDLERLNIDDNKYLERLDLDHPTLKNLEACGCTKLREVRLNLPQADNIGLNRTAIKHLSLEGTPMLRVLGVENSKNLEEIKKVPTNTFTTLYATGADSLEKIDKLGECRNLDHLKLQDTKVKLAAELFIIPSLTQIVLPDGRKVSFSR